MSTTKVLWWFMTVMLFTAIRKVNTFKQKRQIFREHVLPSKGGKIPEEAFRADRLALNRLNKEGITVPDGVVLEARHVQKHPTPASKMPDVLKVLLTPDGRYVTGEGRYNYDDPKSVDTTYLIRHPIGSESTQGKYKYRNGGYNSLNKLDRYPKSFGAPGYRQFVNPTRSGPRAPLVYKPILEPLIIPTPRGEFLHKNYYNPPNYWNPELYNWDLIYEPFDDYFINGIALFDSHKIITDYEGFLNDFHGRSTRNVNENSFANGLVESSGNFFTRTKSSAGGEKLSFARDKGRSISSGYPSLENIPETRFTCAKKRGIFADFETKCQVFHKCDAGGKSSFLCAAGTIFNEFKKRCERWNNAACNIPLN